MLDPETFMKNSPFQASHTVDYHLSNTTPELLKFQLREQSRDTAEPLPALLESLSVESSFNTHLKSVLDRNSVSVDDELDRNDEFSRTGQSSGSSTPSSVPSESWKELTDSSASSHMNLRVLIENSVFDTAKLTPKVVLSLPKVKALKSKIAERTEHKQFLTEKLALSNQFCTALLSNPATDPSSLDSSLLLKVLKQNSSLQNQLMEVTQELEELNTKLTNHNLVCLIMGYIEDVKHSVLTSQDPVDSQSMPSSKSSANQPSNTAFDNLFSHIAATAAQKSVTLPPYPSGPESNTLQSKISWATQCIDSIAGSAPSSLAASEQADRSFGPDDSVGDQSFLSASPHKSYKNSSESDKTLAEYKLALSDLRFSHEYFMKEYQYLKENSLKTISDYRKKITTLERELSRQSETITSSSSREDLELKDKEIAKLRKDLSSLKIEALGAKSPRASTVIQSSLLSTFDADSENLSPTHGQPSVSSALLRKEFKKIVADIQDQHDIELEEERFKRRELQEQLDKLTM